MVSKYFIGVDIGGTKVTAGVVTESFKIFESLSRLPTEVNRSREDVLNTIESAIREAVYLNNISFENVEGIGIGTPGPLNITTGEILNPENLKPLNFFNIKKYFSEKLNKCVRVNNDASCFILGELLAGEGKGYRTIIGLTLGTGTGCGLIIDGKLYNGATGTSGEVWKTPFLSGNIEDYTSAKGIKKFYFKRTGRILLAKEIADLAENNDNNAVQSWKEYGRHLGRAVSGFINLLDPDITILGGSLSKSFRLYKEEFFYTLKKYINEKPMGNLKVKISDSGERGAVIGAAALFSKNC